MKKIVSIITVLLALFILGFITNVNAATLDSINVTVDKETVHPNENVTVNIEFGKELGAYTVDIAYDNNLFEYVSSEGGTHSDNGTRIRLYYYDETVGSNPRTNMSVTFKAKTEIITSNPTDFSITAEGMTNPDGSEDYDDITTPIDKSIIVEPKYVDYDIAINYSGDIVVNEEKDMELVISSTMGKNYEHTRIIAEAKTESSGTVKLLAIDEQNLEHDIIQSGFGSASGDKIGGQNVEKKLNIRGLFDTVGTYSITIKLIDRDNSDNAIATKTFEFEVKETEGENVDNDSNNNEVTDNETTGEDNEINNEEQNSNTIPDTLPKTGNTIYFYIIPIILVLVAAYITLKNKE